VESGVKQGDALSAALFGALLSVILKQLDTRRCTVCSFIWCSCGYNIKAARYERKYIYTFDVVV